VKNSSKINFVGDYEPEENACVELINGRIVDVINAKYFDENVKLIIKGSRIEAMPGVEGQPVDIKADFVIDLKGKTVMPGLFNTHCHTTQAMPTFLPDIKDVKIISRDGIIEPTVSVTYDTSYKIKGHPAFDDSSLTLLTEFRNRVHDDIVEEFWIPEFKAGARNYHGKLSNGKMNMFGFLPMKKMFENFATYCTFGTRNLKLLFENGARMTTSNDGGVPPCTVAMMQHEINLFDLFLNQDSCRNIFSGVDAVRMATINGAACLGLEDDFGTVETGKVADLVILDGDPFEDHSVVGSRVAALFKDGRLMINNCDLQVLAAGAMEGVG
jgi:hypothetical protein